MLTNGLPTPLPTTPAPSVTTLSQMEGTGYQDGGTWLVPVDTGQTGGASPQSMAGSLFQSAAAGLGDAIGNTATSTAAAATLNTIGGWITTESLSTAVGSTYSFTLTNSLITTKSLLQIGMYSKTNTGGLPQVVSITPAAGSAVIVWKNTGGTAQSAFNGTMTILFHL
jgi:hypothetical protein